MKIYQVGGCVRDMLLNKQPYDIDHVVVGATIKEMLDKGFLQVGKNFPVFLHPVTKQEYALARKEQKIGNKHTDFEFVFTPDITLAEDMQRRDFTINALAKDTNTGQIVDTVNGISDLEHKIIRHVNSEHFPEDPLRVLRMCRFAAKLDFSIASETMALAKQMVKSGMLLHLPPERIWMEVQKALETNHFEKFVRTAKECGALKVILPEIDKLWNIPEKLIYHPEANSGEHCMLALRKGENLLPKAKFALLLHDVGKIHTPKDVLPSHIGHDKNGIDIINNICKRLVVPNEYKKMALLVCKNHMKFALLPQMRISKKIDIISDISLAFKSRETMEEFIDICRCDMLGRAKNIETANSDNFENAVKISRKIFNLAKDIHATDMPDFALLTKDKNFKQKYKEYVIKRILEQTEL